MAEGNPEIQNYWRKSRDAEMLDEIQRYTELLEEIQRYRIAGCNPEIHLLKEIHANSAYLMRDLLLKIIDTVRKVTHVKAEWWMYHRRS